MNKKLRFCFVLFLLLFSGFASQSQEFYFVRGYVFTLDNEPVIGANVRVFNTSTGTTTDVEGRFEVQVPQGLNRISFSYISLKTQLVEIVVEKDMVKNVYLEEDVNLLREVEVTVKNKDYSYEVIQNVIDNRAAFRKQYQTLESQIYIKAVEEVDRPAAKTPKKTEEVIDQSQFDAIDEAMVIKTDTIPDFNLFEATLTYYEAPPGNQKEERTAVKKLNDQSTLFYKSTTDGDFDFYENLQYIPKISDSQFISPISNLAFVSYKFKFLGSYFEGTQEIARIQVTPKKLGNALYEGVIEVYENIWVLKSLDLQLNRRALRQYKDFGVKKVYEKVEGNWVATQTDFTWNVKEGAVKKEGRTLVKQSGFKFDLAFPKKFFGSELGNTTAEAYKRDTAFWANIRPEPLSKEERRFVMYKDSMSTVMNSKEYLDSVDAIYNKVTLFKVLWSGVGRVNRSKKQEWFFSPLAVTIDPVAVGGFRNRYDVSYRKRFENRREFFISPSLTYGYNNRDLKGGVRANFLYNPIRVSRLNMEAGRGFGVINGAATITDFIRRSNFYQNTRAKVDHSTELLNGLYLNTEINYEKREDLGDFKFSTLGGLNLFEDNQPTLFPTGQLFQTMIGLSFTPKQLYLREPNQKIILGSRFPTFDVRYRQAWSGGREDFSKFSFIEVAVRQTFQVGIIGTSEYRIHAGKFLDTTRLGVMDYKYQRGGDPYFFSPAMFTFQLIDKTFPVFDWYFESHYTHQFNGFLTSKVPLLNKTGIKTMAGGGFLYAPERNYQYSELYFGANRVFKLGRQLIRLGVYNVLSQNNQTGFRNMIKFSLEPFDPSKNTWSF